MRLRLRLQLWMRMLMWVLLLSEACVCHFFGLVFCSFSAELQQLPAVEGCFEAPQQAIALFGLAYQPFENSTFNVPLAWQKFQLCSFKNLAASCLVSPQMPAVIWSVVPVPVPQKKCQPREVLLHVATSES